MFDIRLRLFEGTGARGRVLPTASLTASIQESGTASLKFAVSERVAGRLVAPFLVGVEFSTGGAYAQPRNGLFIVTEEGSDSAEVSKTVEFTGVPFVPWLLEGMHQRMITYAGSRRVGNKHEWPNANPGGIIRTLIDSGKTGGWAPMLACDFSGSVDSAGVAWTAAERWSPEFQDLVTIADIFDAHVDAGLIDWWTEGTLLRVFRPGTGTVFPNVKLGGPGFQRMPVRRQHEGQFNFLTIIAEDGARYYDNPGADEAYGLRHMTATLSGVKLADADRVVAPMLVEGRTAKRELSYEWTPAGDLPVPWVDFQVGDGVTVRDRDGWTEQRVLGVTVSKAESGVTVRATVGAKLLNRLKRAVQRIEGGSLGQISGGTGVTVPVAPPTQAAPPPAPGGLRVESNTAVWLDDGTALTSVGFAWNEVTESTDGAMLDGLTYELWGRLGSDASARLTATDALKFTVQGWAPDVPRYVKVRALGRDGRPGAFSGEIAVTPVVPASIIPKPPTGLAVASNVGAFQADGTAVATVTVTWAPVTLSTDDTPVGIAEYEFTAGLNTQRVTTPSATFTVPTGKTLAVSAQARTDMGVWGDPSAPIDVTGAAPAGAIAAPTVPILDTGMSSVTVKWDGQLTTGAPPAGLGFVYMDIAPDETGPWTTVGTPLIREGGATVRGHMGDTMWVRLRSTDTLGRPGGTSVAVSIVVVGADGDDIVAAAISVNHVSPSFGDDLNLSANEAVTIIVGAQAEQASQIATLDADVSDAQAAADAASGVAGTAQATANDAATQAAAAADVASDVDQRLDTHQTYYRFGVDGLVIGDPNVSAELRLKPDRIEMTQNDVVVSYWEGGVFVADEARLDSAQIGNHQFMAYGAGRTVARPL